MRPTINEVFDCIRKKFASPTCFPLNASKGTKELFSSDHAIFLLSLALCTNFTRKSQKMHGRSEEELANFRLIVYQHRY